MAKETKLEETAAATPKAETPKLNGDPPKDETAVGTRKASEYRDVPTYVYAGPSLPGGLLKSNTILNGTLEEIKAYFEEISANYPEINYEAIKKLIVPVEKLAVTRKNIEETGNLTNKYYCDIQEMSMEAVKKQAEKMGGAK